MDAAPALPGPISSELVSGAGLHGAGSLQGLTCTWASFFWGGGLYCIQRPHWIAMCDGTNCSKPEACNLHNSPKMAIQTGRTYTLFALHRKVEIPCHDTLVCMQDQRSDLLCQWQLGCAGQGRVFQKRPFNLFRIGLPRFTIEN